jgi:hypothetical protein
MGAALSWFAVKGCGRDEALAELGLELGLEVGDDFPERIGFSELPDGWLLFVSRDIDEMFKSRFIALSRHGPAVGCAIEEHVMFMEARGFADGEEQWRITHDPDSTRNTYHLEINGEAPAELRSIHQSAIAQQDADGGEHSGVDYIADVPLDVAKAICGFKHDDEWPETLSYKELRRARPVKPARSAEAKGRPGLLQRLFGRG